jgi:hypothetical protein
MLVLVLLSGHILLSQAAPNGEHSWVAFIMHFGLALLVTLRSRAQLSTVQQSARLPVATS